MPLYLRHTNYEHSDSFFDIKTTADIGDQRNLSLLSKIVSVKFEAKTSDNFSMFFWRFFDDLSTIFRHLEKSCHMDLKN